MRKYLRGQLHTRADCDMAKRLEARLRGGHGARDGGCNERGLKRVRAERGSHQECSVVPFFRSISIALVWDPPTCARVMDSNREIRAMILAAIPYPPLPVEAKRFDEDGNKLGDSTIITSHDILSNLLEQASVRDTADTHKSRKARQMDVLRSFMNALVKDGMLKPDALYKVYCEHTHSHISTYYPTGHQPELKFFPLEHVSKGDTVHMRMCDWMAAQSLLLEMKDRLTGADWCPRHYPELLDAARLRLVSEA